MKSRLFFLLSVLFVGLLSCSKGESNLSPEAGESNCLVFNIAVKSSPVSTKGVKTGWESGDVIYVFFEDNTTQYLKMTFNGTSWNYTDKDGGTSFSGLSLSSSGKKLSAVFFPAYVNTEPPTLSGGSFVFLQAKSGYYMKDEKVPYTITFTGNLSTLSASLHMKAPAGFVQFFVEDKAPVADTYFITERNFSPANCGAITPGGTVALKSGSEGFPLPGLPATVNGDTGYYFYGILKNSCRNVPTTYRFQMVRQSEWRGLKYVSSVKAKDALTTTMYSVDIDDAIRHSAFKLTGWKDSYFLDLGFGSVKWAIGNLQDNSPYIAQPLEPGSYYMWGYTTTYNRYNPKYTGAYIKNRTDAAYAKNALWRLPSQNEINDLANNANMDWSWITTNNNTKQGSYHVTSKKNGLSMVFLTAGWYWEGKLLAEGHVGNFWSSAPNGDNARCLIIMGPGATVVGTGAQPGAQVAPFGDCFRDMGMSIRPVMDL